MNTKNWFQKKVESFKDDFDYRFEKMILHITENISDKMQKKKINRSSLAKSLGISAPAVTKMLNGNDNFTIKRLLSIADSLDLNLEVNFRDKKQKAVTIPICRTPRTKTVKESVYGIGTPATSETTDFIFGTYPKGKSDTIKSF